MSGALTPGEEEGYENEDDDVCNRSGPRTLTVPHSSGPPQRKTRRSQASPGSTQGGSRGPMASCSDTVLPLVW